MDSLKSNPEWEEEAADWLLCRRDECPHRFRKGVSRMIPGRKKKLLFFEKKLTCFELSSKLFWIVLAIDRDASFICKFQLFSLKLKLNCLILSIECSSSRINRAALISILHPQILEDFLDSLVDALPCRIQAECCYLLLDHLEIE